MPLAWDEIEARSEWGLEREESVNRGRAVYGRFKSKKRKNNTKKHTNTHTHTHTHTHTDTLQLLRTKESHRLSLEGKTSSTSAAGRMAWAPIFVYRPASQENDNSRRCLMRCHRRRPSSTVALFALCALCEAPLGLKCMTEALEKAFPPSIVIAASIPPDTHTGLECVRQKRDEIIVCPAMQKYAAVRSETCVSVCVCVCLCAAVKGLRQGNTGIVPLLLLLLLLLTSA